jgi:tetratricopeptide (TPR) repeat protein
MNNRNFYGQNMPFPGIMRILFSRLKLLTALVLLSIPIRPVESKELNPSGMKLLIADFASDADSNDLALLLKPVLYGTLQHSPRLAVYPELKIRRFLKENLKEPQARLNFPLARQICLSEEIPVILFPGLDRINESLIISVRLYYVKENRETFVDTIRVNNKKQLAAIMEELSRRIRLKLGENPESPAMSGHIFSPHTTVQTLDLFTQTTSFYAYRSRQNIMDRLKELLAVNPDMAVAELYLSLHYLRLQQTKDALLHISKAKAHSEGLPLKYRVLIDGISDFLMNRYMEANDHFRSYADSFPYDWQSHFRLAKCAAILGNYSLAIEEYRKAIELDDTQIESYIELSMAMLYARDSLGARRVLEQASLLSPNDPEIAIALGLLELVDNNPRYAIQSFEQSKQYSLYRAHGIFLQAQAKIYSGEFEDALELLSAGIEEDIKNRDVVEESSKRLARAQIYLLRGDSSAADAECQKIPNSVHDPVFMAQKGSIYANAGQSNAAEKILFELRAMESNPFIRAVADCLEGEIQASGGRFMEATQSFLKAKEYTGTPSLSLALALMNSEQLMIALAEFTEIREQKAAMLFSFHKPWFMGTWVRALYDAGQFNLKSGNRPEAKQYFRQYLWVMEGADPSLESLREAEIILTGR